MKSFIAFMNEQESWITIHPNNGSGVHVLIDKKSGEIKSGLGNKFVNLKEFYPRDPKKGKSAHTSALYSQEINTESKKAITSYTGITYKRVNGFLRGNSEISPMIESIVGRLDSLFKKAHTTDDIEVKRGFSSLNFDNFKEGDIIEDKGFMSTTTSSTNSKKYAKQHPEKTCVEITIFVPKGSRAISVKDFSQFKNEEEILIDRGSKLKFKKIKKSKSGNMSIEADLVQE